MVVSFSLYAVCYYSDNYNFEKKIQPKNNGIFLRICCQKYNAMAVYDYQNTCIMKKKKNKTAYSSRKFLYTVRKEYMVQRY